MQKTLTTKQAYWFDHIEKCAAVGGSLSTYAQDNTLSLTQLYSWRATYKKYYAKPSDQRATRFVKADIIPQQSHKLSLTIAGTDISFNELPDPRWLANLCSAANELA